MIESIVGINQMVSPLDGKPFLSDANIVQVFFQRERQQESKSVYMNLKDILSLLLNDVEPSLKIDDSHKESVQ